MTDYTSYLLVLAASIICPQYSVVFDSMPQDSTGQSSDLTPWLNNGIVVGRMLSDVDESTQCIITLQIMNSSISLSGACFTPFFACVYWKVPESLGRRETIASVLDSVVGRSTPAATAGSDDLLDEFLRSRRARRLEPVQTWNAWEEHFADGRRRKVIRSMSV